MLKGIHHGLELYQIPSRFFFYFFIEFRPVIFINLTIFNLHFQGLKYMWYDRTQLTYSNWQPGYPEQGTGKRCVKMWYFSSHSIGWDLGTWENRGCSEKRPYLCSKKADPFKPTKQSYYNPYECPEGWIPHESSCFKFSTAADRFDRAQEICASFSDKKWVGNVITVWNVYQQKLLNRNSSELNEFPVFVNLTDLNLF